MPSWLREYSQMSSVFNCTEIQPWREVGNAERVKESKWREKKDLFIKHKCIRVVENIWKILKSISEKAQ